MATVARRIAEWVTGLGYEQLPDKTVHEVRRRVLDSIGCALGAYHAAPAKIARASSDQPAARKVQAQIYVFHLYASGRLLPSSWRAGQPS